MNNKIQGQERHLIFNLYLNKYQYPRQKNKLNNSSLYSINSSKLSEEQKHLSLSNCLRQKIEASKKQYSKINLIYINQIFQNKFRTDSYESFKNRKKSNPKGRKVIKNRCLSAGNEGMIKSGRTYFNLDLKNKLTCSSIHSKILKKQETEPVILKQSKKTFRSQDSKSKRDNNALCSYRKMVKTQKTARVEKPSPDLQINPWKVTDLDEF